VCDTGIARIEILPGTPVEVFIPVELVEFTQREITAASGQTTIEFVESQRFAPQFRALQTDDVDDDNNVLLRRNMDIRETPSAVVNPVCGTVVAFVMDGVLAVPFLPEGQGQPSYDVTDLQTVAGIGGRYEFEVVRRDIP
ncbi:MAG: hypothetical protein ACE5HE_13790, partial [Phycisphaerae bacterium]